ncbi:MAG: hypothetical protein WD044_05585 [Dongiaceae bacterium]
MSPRLVFVAMVFVCIVNGMISPALLPVLIFAPLWAPTLFNPSANVLLLLASLMVSTGTLILAGVPAALYERVVGLKQSDPVSMIVWLGAAILLTAPGILALL